MSHEEQLVQAREKAANIFKVSVADLEEYSKSFSVVGNNIISSDKITYDRAKICSKIEKEIKRVAKDVKMTQKSLKINIKHLF